MKYIITSDMDFPYGKRIGNEVFIETNDLNPKHLKGFNYWKKYYSATVREDEEDTYRRRRPTAPAKAPEPVVDTRPDVDTRPRSEAPFVDPIAEDFKRDLQIQIDASMAQHQLNFWGRVHGLRDSAKNAELIKGWLEKNVKGYLSGEGVNVAIANLRSQLEWDSPKPVTVAAPAPKPTDDEVLGTLPNGERQLSLKHGPSRTASTAQLKDYLARYRAANGLQFI